MKHKRKIALIALSLFFMAGAYVTSASAQVRYYRRAYVARPYYYDPFWSGRSSWWYDPITSDPYYWYQREKYYKEKDVRDKARNFRKDREKYLQDGYLSDKEQEQNGGPRGRLFYWIL